MHCLAIRMSLDQVAPLGNFLGTKIYVWHSFSTVNWGGLNW